MQSDSHRGPNGRPDIVNDDITQARVHKLQDRLTARARTSTRPEGVPSEEIPRIRWGDSTNQDPATEQLPFTRWDDRANHHLGSRAARSSPTMQRLHALLKSRRYEECRDELVRAELAAELSEFHALNYQAILAVVEGSEFASDYLEMAEAVASSPYELAVVAENRAAHDLLQGNPVAAAEHCLAILDHVCQTEGLWSNLLIALHRLGEVEAIDATLQSFTRLNDECTTRLMGLITSDPDLHDVRVRPAFRALLNSRTAGQAGT